MTQKHLSKNLEETKGIAQNLAVSVSGGDVFALQGDLGSGKTTFARFFAAALGIDEDVTSPTYVIAKSYFFTKEGKKLRLIHIDAYRLDSPDEAETIGLEEMISDKGNILLIEWPEKLAPKLDSEIKIIDFKFINETTREITFQF